MGAERPQRVRRRLAAIASQRSTQNFQFFKLGRRWFTTKADLRRVVPELFTHEEQEADSLRSLVDRLAVEVRELRQRVDGRRGGIS